MMLLPIASMGRITGRLGLAFIRLPFVLLHIPVAPLPWVGVFRVCVLFAVMVSCPLLWVLFLRLGPPSWTP